MFSVSVVIPTFNGRDLLLKNLPPLLAEGMKLRRRIK